MRKLIRYILMMTGIVTMVYSVAIPWQNAVYDKFMSFSSSLYATMSFWDQFIFRWSQAYAWLTAVGAVMVLVSIVLYLIFRRSNSSMEPLPAVLLSGGAMLETVAVLQAWTDSLSDRVSNLAGVLSSSVINVDGAIMYPSSYSPWHSFLDCCSEYVWMFLLGILMIIAGLLLWAKGKSKTAAEVSEEPAKAEEAPKVKIPEREEWRVTLHCTVMDIRGDYALVKYDDTGIESEVAIALLPFGIDVGDKLKFENYEFERV